MTGRAPPSGHDLSDPELYDDGIPHHAFAPLRSSPDLPWNPLGDTGFWAVTRQAELIEVSRDSETYSSAVGHIQLYDIDSDALDARASMIDMDPPVHTRLRRLVSSAFTPRHVAGYRASLAARTTRLIDRLVAQGGGDWVQQIAAPIPIGAICDILGVPDSDHAYLIELSDHLVAGTSNRPLDPGAYGNTTDLRLLPFESPAAFAMSEYAHRLGNLRRSDPQDDLVTLLVHAEVDGERLTDAEFANFFRLMIFAGNETTRSAIAHLAIHLDDASDQFERVAVDPSLVSGAVEEVVRYSSPILYFRRTATRDTELGGTAIAAGDKVVMWYCSANFDEAVYDDPLTFDVGRPPRPTHMAYGGGGAHYCLGAPLARLELAVLIEQVVERQLTVTTTGTPHYVRSNFVNGITHLEVAVT